jgi:hypothetical protein
MSRNLKRYWRDGTLVKLPVKDFTRHWVTRCRQWFKRQRIKAERRQPIDQS